MSEKYLFVLGICFICIVVPMWLKMHYGERKKLSGSLEDNEKERLQGLNRLADQLSERVKNLESILDAESPDWRTKYD